MRALCAQTFGACRGGGVQGVLESGLLLLHVDRLLLCDLVGGHRCDEDEAAAVLVMQLGRCRTPQA